MSAISNTYQTYDTKGIREDLSDAIYNISPEDTPFMSSVGRGKAEQTLFEWQTDALAAPDAANAQLEGNDYTSFQASTPTVRLGNHTQISAKTAIVSGTNEKVKKAGRDSEMAYQLSKRSPELKRDIETILIGTNQGAVAGDSSTARKTAAMLAWLKTNTTFGSGGVDPVYTTLPSDVRTDGTTRQFTETILKENVQLCWAEGANTDTIMCGGLMKQHISTFSGVATKTIQQTATKAAKIIGAVDIYVSDFGTFAIVPNRFQRERDVWFLDNEFISVDYLRPFKTEPLAKSGDATKRLLLAEYGLRVKNEKALGLAADLKTTA